jgi:hypothetical protein
VPLKKFEKAMDNFSDTISEYYHGSASGPGSASGSGALPGGGSSGEAPAHEQAGGGCGGFGGSNAERARGGAAREAAAAGGWRAGKGLLVGGGAAAVGGGAGAGGAGGRLQHNRSGSGALSARASFRGGPSEAPTKVRSAAGRSASWGPA